AGCRQAGDKGHVGKGHVLDQAKEAAVAHERRFFARNHRAEDIGHRRVPGPNRLQGRGFGPAKPASRRRQLFEKASERRPEKGETLVRVSKPIGDRGRSRRRKGTPKGSREVEIFYAERSRFAGEAEDGVGALAPEKVVGLDQDQTVARAAL